MQTKILAALSLSVAIALLQAIVTTAELPRNRGARERRLQETEYYGYNNGRGRYNEDHNNYGYGWSKGYGGYGGYDTGHGYGVGYGNGYGPPLHSGFGGYTSFNNAAFGYGWSTGYGWSQGYGGFGGYDSGYAYGTGFGYGPPLGGVAPYGGYGGYTPPNYAAVGYGSPSYNSYGSNLGNNFNFPYGYENTAESVARNGAAPSPIVGVETVETEEKPSSKKSAKQVKKSAKRVSEDKRGEEEG